MANVNIRIDQEIKEKAEAIFKQLGLTPTTAITLFYNQVIRTKSIPFELKTKTPNKSTKRALKELSNMEKNPENYKSYKNADELIEDLNK